MAEQQKPTKISGHDVPKPADTFRGAVMAQNSGTMNNQVNMGAQRAGKSAASMQSSPFGGKADNVMQLETDAAPNAKAAQKVEIRVVGGDVAPVAAEAKVDYSDAFAIQVPGSSPQETLSKLNTAITAQSDACSFTLDADSLAITDGQVFVGSFFVVNFRATVAEDGQGKGSTISFFRDSGDDLAAAKFLGNVQAAVLGEAAPSMIALDASVEDMDVKMDVDDAAKEKMEVMDALNADDSVQVEMGGASEQYLTQKLLEAEALSKDNTLEHAKLVQALLEEDVLGHQDVAVVRAACLILAQLVKSNAAQIVTGDTFEVLAGAVAKAECGALARRYAVCLLSAMAQADGAWKVAEKDKATLVAAVKAVQAELGKTKGVDMKQREFDGVACEAVLAKLEG